MRAQQRNRLIWNIEQIVRLGDGHPGKGEVEVLEDIKAFANIALKIARADEATFAGRIPPIRPGRRA